MANSLIGNAAVATHLYQALYGMAPSNALYNSYIADIAANGQTAFAKTMAGNFSATSDAALALQVLKNLGITATTVTATGEYNTLLSALTAAFAAYPTMRGQVILNATNLFANLEGDATYGGAAVAYNQQGLANFTYASNTANTAPAVVGTPESTLAAAVATAATASATAHAAAVTAEDAAKTASDAYTAAAAAQATADTKAALTDAAALKTASDTAATASAAAVTADTAAKAGCARRVSRKCSICACCCSLEKAVSG